MGAGRRRYVVLGLLVVVLAAGAVWFLTQGDPGADTGAVTDVVRDDLALTGVQLTSIEAGIDPATGLPTQERRTYSTGEGARLWVQFTYTGDEPGQDALFVRWYRDDTEIFQSSWRLPQPVENHNVALGASYMEEAGTYRVDVLLNDEVLQSRTFDVE